MFAEPQHRPTVPLSFTYSASIPKLLEALKISLLISAYQAGKLIVLRAKAGELTAIVRHSDRVMGIAVTPEKLAVGTRSAISVWENSSLTGSESERCQAWFVPHPPIVTGDLGVREVAWGEETLWLTSTRFSALFSLTLRDNSCPIINTNALLQCDWQPPFLMSFEAEDRCHLNGIAMVNGQPQYVTVLAATDAVEGWRKDKINGGCAIDVTSGEIVARGFSMPHSPRVYDNRLWLLDSGRGRLVIVDAATGQHDVVAEFPGFARGLAFCDRYAFVGLSKIRDSTTFRGLPIERHPQTLECAVWVVKIDSGKVLGSIKFQSHCNELFDVQILENISHPTLLYSKL
ncbi:TIGR03032 family protein [Oscillatoria sp. FACHB-1406]|uniref:TIGR03032 family protein n=1 Tax=Oscillatoria sp. FACHB-1406 TaxID=2692846 RepID=UPI0016851EB3|nr:TIGR03032 family protein [Oscillatoria sp. FACHB-1406]MBD2576891.1 TIGR03032 family protein [Oscillatoria sp. FACHB-1406]